jgi:Fur family iron response transcriptional regulator
MEGRRNPLDLQGRVKLMSDTFSSTHARPGCPVSQVRERLRRAGLRPTLQRVSLGWLLFGKGDRHVTAEMLFEEARKARIPVSLATVYNTLKQFTEAGLVRQIAADGRKSYFDTDLTDHHHFLIHREETIIDIPCTSITVTGLPAAPSGYEFERAEVVVRLRRAGPRDPSELT